MNKINYYRSDNGVLAYVDGRQVPLKPSLKVWNHSPSGFEVGYGGSGVAQLALAVLMMFADKNTASQLHQEFKWQFLADEKYQQADVGEIQVDISAWIKAKITEVED